MKAVNLMFIAVTSLMLSTTALAADRILEKGSYYMSTDNLISKVERSEHSKEAICIIDYSTVIQILGKLSSGETVAVITPYGDEDTSIRGSKSSPICKVGDVVSLRRSSINRLEDANNKVQEIVDPEAADKREAAEEQKRLEEKKKRDAEIDALLK